MSGLEAFLGFLGAVVIVAVGIGGSAWVATLVPTIWILTVFVSGLLLTILGLGFYFLWLSEV